MSNSVTVRLPESTIKSLDALASATERNRAYFMTKAIQTFLKKNFHEIMKEAKESTLYEEDQQEFVNV